MLSKNDIQNIEDLPTKTVTIKEWGGDVKISVLSVGHKLTIGNMIEANPDDAPFYWITAGCVEPEFSADDIPMLKKKSLESIVFLYEAILDLNKQTSVDQNAKNS